jgi:hypothetical protein
MRTRLTGYLAAAIVVYIMFYFPKEAASEIPLRVKMKKIDIGGIILGPTGLILFIMGISLGGNPDPWKSGKMFPSLITF